MKRVVLGIMFALLLILINSLAYSNGCKDAEQYIDMALKVNTGRFSQDIIKKEALNKKAIKLCPSNARAHNNLADVYEKQGRYENAIAEYKMANELNPEVPYPYFGIGDIYYRTNRFEEAKIWYEKGLKYAPNDRLTKKMLALINDIKTSGVIKADTIQGMMTTTRGPGKVVSITFGEGLVPFDYDNSDIREDAKIQLSEIGKAFKLLLGESKNVLQETFNNPVFEIAGHTDKRGTDEYNLLLSRRRAKSVMDYLVKEFNVPRGSLFIEGYGERVPLCSTGDTKACHAMNRRVEIAKIGDRKVTTRSASFRGFTFEPNLIVDSGFFCQNGKDDRFEILKEDSKLRSGSSRYFMFFRPAQDCYAYILQEDSSGGIDLLFPTNGRNGFVKAGKDYWIPEFCKAYTLDDTKGRETLYLLVTSWPMESELETLSLGEMVKQGIGALKTRSIVVNRPTTAPEHITQEELKQNQKKIEKVLSRIEGKGGWVKAITFWHD